MEKNAVMLKFQRMKKKELLRALSLLLDLNSDPWNDEFFNRVEALTNGKG